MQCLKRVTSLLCAGVLLVSVAVGARVPHFSEGNHFASRRHNNALSMQGGQSCPRAGACELCQSAQIGQRDFHVCPDDGDACDPVLCFYSLACRCSPVMLQSPLMECNKTTNVFVEGKSVTVTYYTYVTPGRNVPDQSCFTTLPLIDSCTENCNQTCSSTAPPCVNNTKTGDFTSCDADGCECIDDRWLQPDCCNCDYRNYYGPDCDKTCTENCGQPRPFEGGCLTCSRDGYEPPSCCNCTEDRIKFGVICKCRNGTNTVDGTCKEGFAPEDCCKCLPGYTANENEECKKTVCQPNCADYNSQTGVCNACSGGFLLPTCCNCPSGKQNVNGVCKCQNNTEADGSCKEGYAPEDCCECAPGYTKNQNGECKKTVCESKCANYNSQTGVCSACSRGFELPTCCNCPTGKQNVNGVCKCEGKFNLDGICIEGYAPEDCCQCAPGYTMNQNGECKKTVCESKCANYNSQTGVCSACSNGFELPTCCNCPTGKQNINGVCKCKSNINPDGTCKEGYAPEDCCECLPGYISKDGKCEQQCSREQNVYFLLDGSQANKDFPSLLLAVQMLVAAFNPVPNQSGTKVSVVLFGDGSQYAPSVMSTIDDRCEDIKSKLIELQYEFQVCDTNANKYEKKKGFESLCAKGSSAASGLKAIKEMIASSSSINSALVIMTDALLSELNDPEDRINAINALKDENLNLKTILASGITNPTQGSGATYANLVEYTRSDSQEFSDDHVVLGDSAIDVGRRVVKQMAESGIICADYATRIKEALSAVQTANLEADYKTCHNKVTLVLCKQKCEAEYPTCGGSVSTTVKLIPPKSPSSFCLKEEILAAIEEVVERFEG